MLEEGGVVFERELPRIDKTLVIHFTRCERSPEVRKAGIGKRVGAI
jgi:hypothetical protein